MKESAAEAAFALLVKAQGWPVPKREHRFHPQRRWRFDFAWTDVSLAGGWRLAVEIEGVTRQGGRHQRATGFLNDAEKYLEAMRLGWLVLRVPASWICRGERMVWRREVVETIGGLLVDGGRRAAEQERKKPS